MTGIYNIDLIFFIWPAFKKLSIRQRQTSEISSPSAASLTDFNKNRGNGTEKKEFPNCRGLK
jgi:hypothetical protein